MFIPMKKEFIICLLSIIISSCYNSNIENRQKGNNAPIAIKPFSTPTIPNIIQDEPERIAYICKHFWDSLDTRDSTMLKNIDMFENYFSIYLTFIKEQTTKDATENIEIFLKKIDNSKEWIDAVLQLATKYLYHIESPFLNEELYIPFAEYMLRQKNLCIEDSILYNHRLEVALKNRPGSIANDFSFVTAKGKQTTLHNSIERCTLLFFNDPECENCKEAKSQLIGNDIIRQMTENGTLQPIMIYTEGDSEVWKQHKHDCPKGWISGFDAEENIRMRRIYELRAMPCIYLIDKDKKVILKDVNINTLITYLNSLGGV